MSSSDALIYSGQARFRNCATCRKHFQHMTGAMAQNTMPLAEAGLIAGAMAAAKLVFHASWPAVFLAGIVAVPVAQFLGINMGGFIQPTTVGLQPGHMPAVKIAAEGGELILDAGAGRITAVMWSTGGQLQWSGPTYTYAPSVADKGRTNTLTIVWFDNQGIPQQSVLDVSFV